MKWLVLILLLAACGTAQRGAPSALRIAQSFELLGARAAHEQDDAGTVPRSYAGHAVFAIPESDGHGGQVFTCEDKAKCDAIVQYFTALAGLAGPWLYQSIGGRVVVQLSSQTPAETAARYAATVQTIKD